MADTKKPDIRKQTSDEIDLLELFRKTGQKINQFFSWVLRTFFLTVIFFWRNALYLIGFVILGALIGYGYSKTQRKYYSSDMEAQTNAVNAAEIISYINTLNDFTSEGNKDGLRNYLNLSDTLIESIKDIKAFWIVDENKDGIGDYVDFKEHFNINDTTKRRLSNRFSVKVDVFDNTVFEEVKKGIYNYIDRNPYVASINENRKKRIRELISKTDEELIKLDSLQKYEYFEDNLSPESDQGQMLIWNEKDIRLLHNEIINLYKDRQDLERELELFPEPITIIQDFTPLTQFANPKSIYIMNLGIIFFILGTIFLFLKKQWSNIQKFMGSSS
jgi:hypothetical protein